MKLKKCPEIEGENCETIFEDTSLEYYTYYYGSTSMV
jgi:hypothetical protein